MKKLVFIITVFLLSFCFIPQLPVQAKKTLNYVPLCMKGHAAKLTTDVQPTCTKKGKYVYKCQKKKCPNYGKVIEQGTWAKLSKNSEHSYGSWKKSGKTHYRKCKKCGHQQSHKASWKWTGEKERYNKKTGETDNIDCFKCKNCNLTKKEYGGRVW